MRIPAASALALAASLALTSVAHATSSAQASPDGEAAVPELSAQDDDPTWARTAPTSLRAIPEVETPPAPTEVPAYATSERPRGDRALAVQGAFGLLGGPTGIASMLVDYSPNRWFAVTAGLGLGGNESLQYAASARVRVPVSGALALGLGGGLSGGGYTPVLQGLFAEGYYEEVTYGNVLWGNVEVSVEARSRSGFFFRLFFGGSQALATGSTSCVQFESGKRSGPSGECHSKHEGAGSLPYLTLALGKSFSI